MSVAVILGSTGLLGQAVSRELTSRGYSTRGIARSGAEIDADAGDADSLASILRAEQAELVINCAALTDLSACERDPDLAHRINAGPAQLIAELSEELGYRSVYVSTDHYWQGDGRRLHAEDAPVRLVNEYARSKHAGERFALSGSGPALAIRTNIVGVRAWKGRPTFAEWAAGAIRRGESLTLFDDFFTSPITAAGLAVAIADLLEIGAEGLLNVAASEATSKLEFVLALAQAMSKNINYEVGSVSGLEPPRANSLGLDVSRAEGLLRRPLPDADAVTAQLAKLLG